MLTTATEVYDRVRTQVGKLARRAGRELMTPSNEDEDALELYLEDAISEICTITERMRTSVQLATVPSQEYVERPPYLFMVEEASIYDGGTSYGLEVESGPNVARWSRAPDADEGRPTHIGAHDGQLYLWPIPQTEYTVDLQITYNGLTADAAPSGPQDPPQLDTMVEQVPKELNRALAGYVTAEWLEEIGEPEVAQKAAQRFETDVRRFKDEPVHDSTATRPYRPLGF